MLLYDNMDPSTFTTIFENIVYIGLILILIATIYEVIKSNLSQ